MTPKELQALDQEFNAAYEFLYEYGDTTPAYDAAVADFDNEMQKRGKLWEVAQYLANYRLDLITSDREAAAFMIAYKKLYAA